MKRDEALRRLELRARRCKRCGLHSGRNNVVFGSGPANAKVMLVGEAPGRSEDRLGLPFVGSAGKRLNELLKIASLKRENVYVTNVVLCRPPENRRPAPEEINACRGFLEERMAIIRPQLIVALGKTSAEALLDKKVNMTEDHGKLIPARRGNVFITYHPAAALYRGTVLEAMKRDFKRLGLVLREILGKVA